MALADEDEIDRRLAQRADWSRDGGVIRREVDCGDFAGSIELVDRIAAIAEERNHHPDLAISWDTVTIALSTHSEGGLTAADFDLAEQIDALVD